MSDTDAPLDFPESRSLALAATLSRAYESILRDVAGEVRERGFETITPAHVNFISALDCGVTQSSEVARRLGVSRQAVYRVARELTAAGVIELVRHPERGNEKVVQFTPDGERLVSELRQSLARMDQRLEDALGLRGLDQIERLLDKGWPQEA